MHYFIILLTTHPATYPSTLLVHFSYSMALNLLPATAHPDPVIDHPQKHLLPVAHVGNDKDGRPIYWVSVASFTFTYIFYISHFFTAAYVTSSYSFL